MGLIAFDTIEYSRKLQNAGMPPLQADAIASAQREMFADILEQKELATKVDIVLLQKDIADVRTKLEQDMANTVAASERHLTNLLLGIATAIITAIGIGVAVIIGRGQPL